MNTIENLYHARISVQDRVLSKENKSALKKVCEYQDKISELLPQSAQQLLEEYNLSQTALDGVNEVDLFCIGFRLGVKLMVDVYTVDDGVIDNPDNN